MILEKVNYPEDLKPLNIEDKKILAKEIREKVIKTVSETGGHLIHHLIKLFGMLDIKHMYIKF